MKAKYLVYWSISLRWWNICAWNANRAWNCAILKLINCLFSFHWSGQFDFIFSMAIIFFNASHEQHPFNTVFVKLNLSSPFTVILCGLLESVSFFSLLLLSLLSNYFYHCHHRRLWWFAIEKVHKHAYGQTWLTIMLAAAAAENNIMKN